MYHYQLMLAKEWALLQQAQQNNLFGLNHFVDPFLQQPRRIKYFYDSDYKDIITKIVNEPDSCQDFYSVLQKVGLPYRTYYHRITDKVTNVFQSALAQERIILLRRVNYYGYTPGGYLAANNNSRFVRTNITQMPPEPEYIPDDSWIALYITNYHQQPIQIYDPSDNHLIASTTTSEEKKVLKQSHIFDSETVLPKVNLYLGGIHQQVNPEHRGYDSLRVKQSAQSWLNSLSDLLRQGKSPFTLKQNKALASLINLNITKNTSSINAIDAVQCVRVDQKLGHFFGIILQLLNQAHFFVPINRIGDCSANQSEGALIDSSLYRQAKKSLGAIQTRQCINCLEDTHNQPLYQIATNYIDDPIISASTITEAEKTLDEQANESLAGDYFNKQTIELYIDAIKLLKYLAHSGLIKHVETRKEYKLKLTKLDYQYVEVFEQSESDINTSTDFNFASLLGISTADAGMTRLTISQLQSLYSSSALGIDGQRVKSDNEQLALSLEDCFKSIGVTLSDMYSRFTVEEKLQYLGQLAETLTPEQQAAFEQQIKYEIEKNQVALGQRRTVNSFEAYLQDDEYGQALNRYLDKQGGEHHGNTIYQAKEFGYDRIQGGEIVTLNAQKDAIMVYDNSGKFKEALNFDGSKNSYLTEFYKEMEIPPLSPIANNNVANESEETDNINPLMGSGAIAASGSPGLPPDDEDKNESGNKDNIKMANTDYLKKKGFDAHKIKEEFFGRGSNSKYDIFIDKQNGELILFRKGGLGNGIRTGYFIK